jgi:hypothetical protein
MSMNDVHFPELVTVSGELKFHGELCVSSGGNSPTWVPSSEIIQKEMAQSYRECSYCASSHNLINCPNCGAPK